MSDDGPTSPPSGRGFFDGFEAYLTPTDEGYSKVLREGLVVLDANVLLNLYRYTVAARDALLSVIEGLGSQLWLPHQVVHEFWRNRESVLRDPRDTKKTAAELTEHQLKAEQAFRTWANRVSLPLERATELLKGLATGFEATLEGIDEYAAVESAAWARNSNTDPVLARLREALKTSVGSPLPPDEYEKAVIEGLRRVEERIPPGYKDRKKADDDAAGDYLVWEQTIREATRRNVDVLFVTSDAKEDWWREENGERRGPRPELARELRERAKVGLLMIRPTRLLELAPQILEVSVSDETVEDADRVDRYLATAGESLDGGGWSRESIEKLLTQLESQAHVQAAVIREAIRDGGFVSRERVYELGRYPEDRSLRGFTRPVNRITELLKKIGYLPVGAVDLVWSVYNEDSPNFGWAAGFRIHPDVMDMLELDAGAEDETSVSGGDAID